jgi:tripartite-type tricarboxylate transporter receptor subunit TctC
LPHIKAGKIRVLAVFGEKRESAIPDVPTAKEEGVNASFLMWRGVHAPKGTPRPIVDKLGVAFKKMTEDKTVVAMINQFGDEIQYLGPDEFTKVWREEYEGFKALAKTMK